MPHSVCTTTNHSVQTTNNIPGPADKTEECPNSPPYEPTHHPLQLDPRTINHWWCMSTGSNVHYDCYDKYRITRFNKPQ